MSGAEETEALRASFREVLEDVVASGDIRRHVDAGAARCDSLWTKAADLGWFALLTPESYGGLGLDRAAAAALYQELGRAAAPLPILGSLIASELIAKFGSDAQQAAWLPRLASGQTATFSAGHLAPSGGEPRLHGDALDGDVRDLLDGAEASLLLTPVKDGGRLRWAMVDTAGVAMQRHELVDRTRGLAWAQLAGVEASALPADAVAVASAMRLHSSIAVACDSVGGAAAILELTVQYLKTREQFGKPIGSFQALKHRCAEHKVAIESADALLTEAISLWTSDDPQAELFAMLVKSQACDVYAAVATDAVQLHGGIGFTWEHACHVYLKRAKLNQALFGLSAEHRDAAARLLAA